jgi:hypothetical protein
MGGWLILEILEQMGISEEAYRRLFWPPIRPGSAA